MPSDYGSNSRKKWLDEDVRRLKELARSNTSTGSIARKLGRSKVAVSIKASKLGIHLGATSQKKQPEEIELSILNNEIQEFEALHPNPNEWTSQQVAHYDSLTKRHTKLRAKIAELRVCRPHS